MEHGIEDVDVGEEEDADLENAANTIPKRFIDGMNGDMTEALRRWKETIKWRCVGEPRPSLLQASFTFARRCLRPGGTNAPARSVLRL